jgi:oligopeptide transport system substrate-binding protein
MQQVSEMARVACRRQGAALVPIRGLALVPIRGLALVSIRTLLQCTIRTLLQCSILFLVICGAGCDDHSKKTGVSTSPSSTADTDGGSRTLRRGLPGDPRTLDPQLADDNYSFQVVRDLYEGLTAEDPAGQIVPGVANSWTIDASGKVYTFHLRPDAKWSDGHRTVATEFVQGLRRAVDPKTASDSAGLLSVIKGAGEIIAGHKPVVELGATAINESTVRIELEHPAPFILQILSQPIAAPVHLGTPPDHQSVDKSDVYNGAYVLVTRVPGSFIELARNPNYWNSSHVAIGKVRYVNSESEATELREYIANQLDMTFTIPMPDLGRVLENYTSEVQTAPYLGTFYLALNLTKPPLKDTVSLRQALSMAVDRELIADHVMMGVAPAYTFVASGTSGYDRPEYEWATWTRERQLAYARTLYARSGYSEKNPLHLKLYFNTSEGIQRIMIAIAGSWKQNLGVVSELDSDEFRVFLAGRKDHTRWDVARLGWDADYDDPSSFLDVFTPGNNQNDSAYNNTAFNEAILEARVDPRPDSRLMHLSSAEKTLLNDYPIIPIYFKKARRLVKPYVGGAQLTPMNRTYSKNLFWK